MLRYSIYEVYDAAATSGMRGLEVEVFQALQYPDLWDLCTYCMGTWTLQELGSGMLQSPRVI